jgi:hypothetical protein
MTKRLLPLSCFCVCCRPPPPTTASSPCGTANVQRLEEVDGESDTFRIQDGAIVANGPRCHLYYVGDVNGGSFKNFELKVDVMTRPKANGGVYFHTAYQPEGWPSKGFEVQVNNSHTDWRRSGGLYAVDDVKSPPVKDNEWFTQHIVVRGDRVTIYLDGKQVVDWTQPAGWSPPEGMEGRRIGSGTLRCKATTRAARSITKTSALSP